MSDSDRCPNCKQGTLRVYSTRVEKRLSVRTQYLKCTHCSYTGKQVVSLSQAPIRLNMRKSWIGRRG